MYTLRCSLKDYLIDNSFKPNILVFTLELGWTIVGKYAPLEHFSTEYWYGPITFQAHTFEEIKKYLWLTKQIKVTEEL
jgi:hypothetical protein